MTPRQKLKLSVLPTATGNINVVNQKNQETRGDILKAGISTNSDKLKTAWKVMLTQIH